VLAHLFSSLANNHSPLPDSPDQFLTKAVFFFSIQEILEKSHIEKARKPLAESSSPKFFQ